MYISCGDDGTGVESEMGYVPNNPLFGMPLDSPQECPPTCAGCTSCQGGTALPLQGLHGSDFDCGNCLDHNGVLSQPNLSGGYWTADDMNSFTGLSPLDMDPLPSLFPFSPCGASYKTERPTHDMADVLLSLKHAVLKPSPEPPHSHQHLHQHPQQHQMHQHQHQHQQQPNQHQMSQHSNGSSAAGHLNQHQHQHQHSHHQLQQLSNSGVHYTHPQASLSYTVHPHQMLVSTSPTLNNGSGGNHPTAQHHNQQLQQQQHQQQQHQQQQHQQQHQQLHHQSMQQSNAAAYGGYYDATPMYGHQSPAPTPQPPPSLPPPPAMYPSMSLNVSMNMTMHGYGGPEASVPLQCSQMQWTPQTTAPAAMNVLYPPLLSPSGHHYPSGATYSFTADFRPPTAAAAAQSLGNGGGIGGIGSSGVGPLPATSAGGCSSGGVGGGVGMPMDAMKMPSGVSINGGESPQRSGPYYHHSHHHHHHHHAMMTPQHLQQQQPDLMAEYSPPHSPNYVQIRDTKSFEALDLELDDDEDALSADGADGIDGPSGDAKPNLCRLCGKTYARPSTLKTHLRTHSGERPYRCPDCNKSFSQAANLTAHVRTHTGQKPFRCPICDRRFSQSSSVTTHMRTHSGERPYRCRSCKKAFSDSSTLTKHLRIHSGEKPYQCKLCLLRFSQSGNLNRHMRVHGTNGNILT